VTQGDCIYRSEAELVATRSADNRAEYVHSLRQQHQQQQEQQLLQQQKQQEHEQEDEQQQQYRVDSVDMNTTTTITSDAQRVFSGDWQNPITALPKNEINPVVPLHPLLVPLSSAAGTSNITHVYDHEVDGILLSPAVSSPLITTRTIEAINITANCSTQPTPAINEAAAEEPRNNTDASNNHQQKRKTEQQKNEFFDPLLRPPPKVQTPWTAALMVLVPLMLGISTVNKEYIEVQFKPVCLMRSTWPLLVWKQQLIYIHCVPFLPFFTFYMHLLTVPLLFSISLSIP